ncbi:hypothetical protein H1235_15715 [Pseudoxanthomonas sp. NC8]|nr:hypothetical protein H1235_15715 [Pseudoxanthomonas sp. NC8]
MPEAVSSIAYEIDPDNAAQLADAHREAVAALKAADVGFVEGKLYRMEGYEGAYFDIWRWQSPEAAEQVTELRVTIRQVQAYIKLIESEPLYTEGTVVEEA